MVGCVSGVEYMHGTIPDAEIGATNCAPTSGSEQSNTPACGSDADDWLFDVAQVLLGKDAGLHLHYITGYPQSTCYAYVAKAKEKRRHPSDHFLRVLFHSEQGEPFFNAFMEGCEARWWLAHKRERKLAAMARHIFASLKGTIEAEHV